MYCRNSSRGYYLYSNIGRYSRHSNAHFNGKSVKKHLEKREERGKDKKRENTWK